MAMTTHERFSRMYAHKEADRVPYLDYPWKETLDRWEAEGLPTRDYISYYDLDKTAYIDLDNSPRFPTAVLEENDDFVVHTTSWGGTMRGFKKLTATQDCLDFKIKTPDDWFKAKERMTFDDSRIPWNTLQKNYKQWRNEGRWITGGFWFGFDITHSGVVGTERLLEAMIEEPEWVMDMFATELELDIQLMDKVWEAGYTFDELHWYDDMGYKQSQFFSLNMYREVLKPYHQKAIDWAHAHGIPARLHSCGDVRPFIPELVSMGLDGLNPLEVKAGVDPVAVKKEFGDQLVLHGGFNAAQWNDPEAISQALIQNLPQLKENGGYIFASDHSIPNSVSLKDFEHIIELYKKYGSY